MHPAALPAPPSRPASPSLLHPAPPLEGRRGDWADGASPLPRASVGSAADLRPQASARELFAADREGAFREVAGHRPLAEHPVGNGADLAAPPPAGRDVDLAFDLDLEAQVEAVRKQAEEVNAEPRRDPAQHRQMARDLGYGLGIRYALAPTETTPDLQRQQQTLRQAAREALTAGAPVGQGFGQRRAFERGFQAGQARMLERMADKATQERATTFRHVTALDSWHGEHGLAPASSRPLDASASFRMDWPLKHSRFIGAGDYAGKVSLTLKHIERCQPYRTGADGGRDMRPLLHAGVELALRNGGDRIQPGQARALMKQLMDQAGDTGQSHALPPDELRMVVAGLVAVWDPLVSNEIALHLLALAGEGPASEQLQAVAQGLGIGMGWKGMDLIHQSYGQLPQSARTPATHDLLAQMDQGQSTGKGWLLRLEQALPGLQGQDPGDALAHLKAVILLRKHFVAHDTPTLAEASTRRTQPPIAQVAGDEDLLDTWAADPLRGRARAESEEEDLASPTEAYHGLLARPAEEEEADPDAGLLETNEGRRLPHHALKVDAPGDEGPAEPESR